MNARPDPLGEARPGAEVIGADGLSKRFHGTLALSSVSFSLRGPQVIGVLGPNGAGKTTLLEILEGLSDPSEGSARLFGEAVSRRHYPKAKVGVVLQREFALDRITAREYAALFAAIYGVRGGEERILSQARLQARAKVAVDRLSGGEAQRLFIAAAVVHEPALLFLDEPTAHLDPASKAQVGEMLCQMAAHRTIVLTTHDLGEADAVCDHLLFLVAGRLMAEGARKALLDAVPPGHRHGGAMEDAFFHYCQARLSVRGELA